MKSKDTISAVGAPVATVQKNRREELRFSVDEFRGHRFISIRIYAPNREGSAMLPSRSGITFKPELVWEVRAALDKTETEARTLGTRSYG